MLVSEVKTPGELSAADADALFALHAAHYEGADPEQFRRDLFEKHWVILLRAETGPGAACRIVGFSTQKLVDARAACGVRALFSGDTVIHREYWGTQQLVRAWCRLAGALLACERETPLYWFLISKGHRTYLYLPLFFREFYPRHDRPTPPEIQRVMDHLAGTRYPAEYDPGAGLIRPAPAASDRLRPELDGAPQRGHNPHVAYFVARNPDYRRGTELVCLARVAPENMRGAARREVEAGMCQPDIVTPAGPA